jgi:hypothetical protein
MVWSTGTGAAEWGYLVNISSLIEGSNFGEVSPIERFGFPKQYKGGVCG